MFNFPKTTKHHILLFEDLKVEILKFILEQKKRMKKVKLNKKITKLFIFKNEG